MGLRRVSVYGRLLTHRSGIIALLEELVAGVFALLE